MDDSTFTSIDVMIGGRSFPVRISTEEEEYVHEVIAELNNTIRDLQNKYTTKDKIDCLTMALLMNSMKLRKAKDLLENQPLTDLLDEVESLLSTSATN